MYTRLVSDTLSCCEQEILFGYVSGDTSLIIGQSKKANWLCYIDVVKLYFIAIDKKFFKIENTILLKSEII